MREKKLEIVDDGRTNGRIRGSGEVRRVERQRLDGGGLVAPPPRGEDRVVLTQRQLGSEHHFLSFRFEMGGHGATSGLATFLEGEVVVAEPVLCAEGVKFVGFGHRCGRYRDSDFEYFGYAPDRRSWVVCLFVLPTS